MAAEEDSEAVMDMVMEAAVVMEEEVDTEVEELKLLPCKVVIRYLVEVSTTTFKMLEKNCYLIFRRWPWRPSWIWRIWGRRWIWWRYVLHVFLN